MRLDLQRKRLHLTRQRLHTSTARGLESRTQHLSELARTLNAVSPLATLQRGYSIVLERNSGQIVRSVEQARTIERFDVRFADGSLPLRRDD